MSNYTILLIDYEPRSIERFRQPLTDAGYTVEVATDGLTGIEAFHRLNPDMVLVEAMIPKKHGFEVCQELKRTPHGRRTPVLITTGVYKGRKYRTQALHIYGCDEYIEKPIAPEQLLAVVGKFFSSSAAAAPEPRVAPPVAPPVIAADDGAGRASVPVSVSHDSPPPRPSVPKASVGSVAKDFTEEEIMARLDAILPGGDFTQTPEDVQAVPTGIATASNPVEAFPISTDAPMHEEQDPFAQMQAELTAELDSMAAALDLESAPVFDPMPQSMPSDQAVSPSVLEALPLPEIETIAAPAPPDESSVPSGASTESPSSRQPGQLVNFDTKRSRKKKHGKKNRASIAAPSIPEARPAPPASEAQVAESVLATSTTAAAETLSLPPGTLVESDLAGHAIKKGVPLWVWAAIVVVALIATYFTLLRGGPVRPDASQAHPAAEIAASTSIPSDTGASQNAPAGKENANLVLNAIGAPVRRPPARPPASVEPPLVSAEPATAVPTAPRAVRTPPVEKAPAPEPAMETPKPADPLTAPPAETNDDVAGVETLVAAGAQGAVPSIAPGTLVDSEELDTAPVSLSRKAPTYSLQARQMRIQGTVVMKVLVNERGTVDEVVLVNGVPGADLNASAMRAAKAWTYRPGTKGGVPVKVWKVEQVAFKM